MCLCLLFLFYHEQKANPSFWTHKRTILLINRNFWPGFLPGKCTHCQKLSFCDVVNSSFGHNPKYIALAPPEVLASETQLSPTQRAANCARTMLKLCDVSKQMRKEFWREELVWLTTTLVTLKEFMPVVSQIGMNSLQHVTDWTKWLLVSALLLSHHQAYHFVRTAGKNLEKKTDRSWISFLFTKIDCHMC